jgi:1,3-propanediol dehydrogenase
LPLKPRNRLGPGVRTGACPVAKGLSQIGLQEEFIPLLSRNALKDACLVTNPRSATFDDIVAIFHKAM